MNHPTDHQATHLRDQLDRLAGSTSAGTGEDGAQLYRRSLQRRRRRAVAGTALVAAATAVVVVGGATWLPSANDGGAPQPGSGQPPVAGQATPDAPPTVPASVDDPGRRTAGQVVEVSKAEAERRCTTVWHNYWGDSAVQVKLRNDSGPWFEGDAVRIANAGQFDYGPSDASSTDGRCVIPQAGLEAAVGTVALPLPAAEDAAGIRASCGQYLGWDFSDWQVIVADGADDRLAAMLRSPDGYVSRCLLDGWYLDDRGAVDNAQVFADPRSGFIPFVEITAPEKFQDEAEAFGDYRVDPRLLLQCQSVGADCLGAGLVTGPEPIARISVTDATGAEQEIPVADGWVAFAGTLAPGEMHFTVYAADGTVLAEYDDGA